MNFKQLKLMRSAARVQRLHVLTTIHRQTVGEHTFGLLGILFLVEAAPTMSLVRACLYHDAAEAQTGDVPAPTKWKYNVLSEGMEIAEKDIRRTHDIEIPLTEREQKLLKYCDLMELAIYASEEVDVGNSAMVHVLRNALAAIRRGGLANATPVALELYQFVCSRTEKHYHPTLGEARFAGWTGEVA